MSECLKDLLLVKNRSDFFFVCFFSLWWLRVKRNGPYLWSCSFPPIRNLPLVFKRSVEVKKNPRDTYAGNLLSVGCLAFRIVFNLSNWKTWWVRLRSGDSLLNPWKIVPNDNSQVTLWYYFVFKMSHRLTGILFTWYKCKPPPISLKSPFKFQNENMNNTLLKLSGLHGMKLYCCHAGIRLRMDECCNNFWFFFFFSLFLSL